MKKNKILTIILCFICLGIFGQKNVENTLTDDYYSIKGTKISLIPPKGFIDAPNFFGLQQTESGSSIMILEVKSPFSEISKAMTKEGLLMAGIEVSKIEKLTINGLPAIFSTGTQNAYGGIFTKYTLLLGSEEETVMINGIFPKNLKKIGTEIKKSLLTVYYEKDKHIDPFETLDYSIDVSDSKLKFENSMSNALTYKVPTSSDDKTSLIITKSFSPITQEDKKKFAINRLKQLPIDIEKIEYTNEISIDGISGYEISAKGKDKKTGEAEKMYMVILFSDKLYYILFGSTNDETENSIDEIKKVVKTFKRK